MAEHYIVEIAELFPPQGQWTEADFFALPESNRQIELTDGELVMSPSPTGQHALCVMRLALALGNFIEQHGLGVVLTAPLDVRLWPGKIRQPDVLFLRNESLGRLGRYVEGAPDWVAEVISPATYETDTVTKLTEYAQAGIPEYWLLDPAARTVTVYVLHGAAYRQAAQAGKGEHIAAVTITGFSVVVDSLFAPL